MAFNRRDLLRRASLLGVVPFLTLNGENTNARALGLLPERLALADAAVADAVQKGVPGAVLLVARNGEIALHKAYGFAGVRPQERPIALDTIFDLASLTKPFAAATAIGLLLERGTVELDAPIARYLEPFARAGGDKAKITVRHLLTHASGLPAGGAYAGKTRNIAQITDEIAQAKLRSLPGEAFLYSDFSAVLLGAIVEQVSGKTLDVFCRERLFAPLGMLDTGYNPGPALALRCAATAAGNDTNETRGIVHDPTARALGGVSGNAGLFSTAADLARFCQMLLNQGSYQGAQILRPETVRLMTTPQSPFVGNARGLGWDLDSGYSVRGALPLGSFGHTGFTGTSAWIDPGTQTVVILLTNAVHAAPKDARSVTPLRRQVASMVASAIVDALPAPGSLPSPVYPASMDDRVMVRTGLETLMTGDLAALTKSRGVGIVCNHSALDRQGRHIADLLHARKNIPLVALYGPEHSIRGTVDASEGDSTDAKTGLPVFSLYNLKLPREQRYRPSPEQLKGIDTLVYDIQDIGARYYTYIATLGYCLEAAAKAGIRVVVLDRPNPLGGYLIEGPLLDAAFVGAFTSYHTMPITHGMTVGELARMFNAERKIGANLEVVAMPNWNRRLTGDQNGLPWVNPSPNIRTIRAAALYPGVGFLESLPISVGRGTDTPFEILGAPWIDALALADNLSARRLPGVGFVPTRFTPTSSAHKNVECGGVQINLWDRRLCRPSELGIHLADALARLYPEKINAETLEKISRSVGNTAIPAAIAKGTPPGEIIASWTGDVAKWRKRRAPFLLYPE